MKKSRDRIIGKLSHLYCDEKGAIAAWFALFLPVFIGFGALALDMSYTMMARQKLQVTASSAALAGAAGLIDGGAAEAQNQATVYATANAPGAGNVLPIGDIQVGTFDYGPPRIFTPGGGTPNAVKVTTHLSEATNNPVSLFLAGIFGMDQTNINTTATAVTFPLPPIQGCIIALNPDPDREGLMIGGNSTITAPDCGICVNSHRDEGGPNGGGLTANGSPEITVGTGGAIIVAGGYTSTGGVSAAPPGYDCDQGGYDICPGPQDNFINEPEILCPDPYESPVPPDYETVLRDPDICDPGSNPNLRDADGIPDQTIPTPAGGTTTGTLFPAGVYCDGINIDGGASVYFDRTGPGGDESDFFILDRTNPAPGNTFQNPDGTEVRLDVNGMSGNGRFMLSHDAGVTFVFSGPEAYWSQENAVKNGTLTGTRVDDMGNPDPSGLPGFLVYQDPLNPADPPNTLPTVQHNINGGTDFFLNGTIYMGMQDLRIRGSIQTDQTVDGGCLAILAGQVDLNGGPDIALTTEGCGAKDTEIGPATYTVRLVD